MFHGFLECGEVDSLFRTYFLFSKVPKGFDKFYVIFNKRLRGELLGLDGSWYRRNETYG